MTTRRCRNPACADILPITEFPLRPGLRRSPLCQKCLSQANHQYNHGGKAARKAADIKVRSIFADLGL